MSEAKTGLVGFFDILGYQNILEKNDPESIAENVLPILLGLSEKTLDFLKKPLEDRNILDPFFNDMNWLIFSDSILLTMAIRDEADKRDCTSRWLIFFAAAVILQNSLFSAGLPVRGAIDYGSFLIKDTCFAGRSIVSAYKLCAKIELAACVFTDKAAEAFKSVNNSQIDFEGVFVTEYLVPMKESQRHHLVLMANDHSENIHKAVMDAFWGHNKDIPIEVRNKVRNTEQWLYYLDHLKRKVAQILPKPKVF